MDFDLIREKLGISSAFIEKKDGYWYYVNDLDVRQMAALFIENGARLITIVAQPSQNGEFRMLYHWDLNGRIAHISTKTQAGQITSIAEICPAADWIEREIHDYYGIHFRGRAAIAPLILRSGDRPGLFYWDGKKMEGEK
ncbi:MAG: NADH-quinone oxidoreductase subunit C [Anaerolineales bacterium]